MRHTVRAINQRSRENGAEAVYLGWCFRWLACPLLILPAPLRIKTAAGHRAPKPDGHSYFLPPAGHGRSGCTRLAGHASRRMIYRLFREGAAAAGGRQIFQYNATSIGQPALQPSGFGSCFLFRPRRNTQFWACFWPCYEFVIDSPGFFDLWARRVWKAIFWRVTCVIEIIEFSFSVRSSM